jgi:hypothetical protein
MDRRSAASDCSTPCDSGAINLKGKAMNVQKSTWQWLSLLARGYRDNSFIEYLNFDVTIYN